MKFVLVCSSRELAIIQSCIQQALLIVRKATPGDEPFRLELEQMMRTVESTPQAFGGIRVCSGGSDIDA
jgi:hypothetical protein